MLRTYYYVRSYIQLLLQNDGFSFDIDTFTYKDNGTDKLIENTSVIGILERRSIFSKVIDKIKQSVIKYLGLYTILDEFKKVHLKDVEAIEAFDIIMNQVKTGNI